MLKMMLPWLFLVLLTIVQADKLPPPQAVRPVCDKADCEGKTIKAKIYIEDTLWDRMGDNPTEEISVQLGLVSRTVNNHLQNLDNGGFKLEFGRNVVKLNTSEIVLEDTYIDRLNNNKTTKVDPTNIFSHTFTFQEAVRKLEDRNSVDLRILFIPNRGTQTTYATSEENCMCNTEGFGCIAVFKIWYTGNWAHHQSLFAHEIGHTLGMGVHDDQFYTSNPKDMLLMWSKVGFHAHIWSPEAKNRINSHNNSCLKTQNMSAGEGLQGKSVREQIPAHNPNKQKDCGGGRECRVQDECPGFLELKNKLKFLTRNSDEYKGQVSELKSLVCNKNLKKVCCVREPMETSKSDYEILGD